MTLLALLPLAAVMSAPAATLQGTWSGSAAYAGRETPFGVAFEPSAHGGVVLRLWIPALHLANAPVARGVPETSPEGISLGGFTFVHDAEAGTLSGVFPEAWVPVHRVSFVLRPADAFPPLQRAPLDAPMRQPRWSFATGAPLWSGATYARGRLLAGDDDGVLHALDAASGRRVWSFATDGAIRALPVVDADDVYLHADDGFVYRLALEDGRQRWKARAEERPVVRLPLDDPQSRYDCFGSAATVAGDRIYVGTHEGRLLAIEREDGSRLWSFQADESVLAAPAVDAARVYFGSYDGKVRAVDAATGALDWEHDTGRPVVSSPVLAEGRVIVGSRSYDLLALDAETGEPAWTRYLWFSWVESTPRIDAGVAYLGSSDAALVSALRVADGRPMWETDVYGWSWGRPALLGERLYVGTGATVGYFVEHRALALALDRETGAPLWRYPLAAPDAGPYGIPGSPAVGDGLVFFTTLDGRILAFDP